MTTYGAATNTYFYLKDAIGSVHALVNTNGTVVEQYKYTAWGEVTVLSSNGTVLAASAYGNRFTFQGREVSYSTGLIIFRSRYYSASLGRWLSKDKIGISGGHNLYEAFNNAPPVYTDAFGNYSTDTHYSRTRRWAQEEGISRGYATLIADADENTDYGATDPLSRGNYSRTENEHFQQFPGHERREAIFRRATEAAERGDATVFGRALHEFQDTYSHEGFKPFPGHAGYSEVDIFNPNSLRDMRMERRTKELLKHWSDPKRDPKGGC
jgi:RHS repeat-associated protein